MKLHRSFTWPAVLSLFLLSGCAHVPSTRYYDLSLHSRAARLSSAAPPREGLLIGVAPFQVDAPYDQDRIVYRIGHDTPEVKFYAYHRWATPLSRMLPKVVAEHLEGASGIASIEPSAPGRAYRALLEGRLIALEEIDTTEGQRAYVMLDLTLRLDDGDVLWSDRLSGEASTRTDRVDHVVEVMRSALGTALDEARSRLERALAR